MADTKFQTILHISDLHFGDGGQNADIPNDIGWIRPLEGFLGHHWAALEQLDRFAWRLKQTDPTAVLVVSGDLTVNGARRQFDLARSFLAQRSASGCFGLELGFPNWLDQTVSGNHDHWPGRSMVFGPPTPAFNNLFALPYPIVPPPVALDPGVTLQYIFFDTDAEVGPFSYDRLFARGKFRKQISKLNSVLGTRKPGEIRVLVMHHAILDIERDESPEHAPFPRKSLSQSSKRFEIEPGSLALLEQAIVSHEIHVVMSGHLHVPRLTSITATSAQGNHTVFDARCGTTTQRDEYPKAFLNLIKPGREALPPNSLILHELWRRDGELVWEAQIYRRSTASGFTAQGQRRSFHIL